MIPIVFTHRGGQEYVRVAVKQAKQWNGRVVLLGDGSNAGWDVEHRAITDYFGGGAGRVADYYVHMCFNSYDFELYNLQRHFVLREFMQREGLAKIFACDSDVMIYADLAEEERKCGDYLAVYSIPHEQWEYRWSASTHAAYWTFGGLCDFCDSMEATYAENLDKLREKWRWHQENDIPGGVGDMTLLWLFYVESGGRIRDICRVVDGVAFDHNIRVGENAFPDEYRVVDGMKDVQWRDGQPYCWHLELERWVRFAALHFQDGAKPKMKEYYRERP
jgi:hypothetical protein